MRWASMATQFSGSQPPRTTAAQYLRMSTEKQDYSLDFQRATNAAYAMERGLTIVRTYSDAGISGLAIGNRDGLKSLLADVVAGQANFSVILVYDVSRWGRFQNPDQAAHYEFICSEAGIKVAYCAEPFDNDGSPASTLLKHMKRAMAAEYSRDLSRKVSGAQKGLLAEGYWTGGRPPFGYRAAHTRRGGQLFAAPEGGHWRKQQGVRTKLVLGPAEEVELVQRIFRMYLSKAGTLATVARALRKEAINSRVAGDWTPRRVGYTLSNQIYIGRLVGGRRIKGVGEPWGVAAPPDQWVIAEDAAPKIIDAETFAAVQRKRSRRSSLINDGEVERDIRRIASEHGDISLRLLQLHGRWSWSVYYNRYRTMGAIRALVGMPVSAKHATAMANLQSGNPRNTAGWQTYSNEDLRAYLLRVLVERGYLSGQLLESLGPPNYSTILRRFGSLSEAYRQVGYEPTERQKLAARSSRLRAQRRRS